MTATTQWAEAVAALIGNTPASATSTELAAAILSIPHPDTERAEKAEAEVIRLVNYKNRLLTRDWTCSCDVTTPDNCPVHMRLDEAPTNPTE